MRLVAWVARAALFLLLFGLALNNLHDVEVRGLFGTVWRAPMIVVILAAFAAGVALAMVALWPHRLRRPAPGDTRAPRPADPPAPPLPTRDGH